MLWILFPKMTLGDVPKIGSLNVVWILFPEMTLADVPGFWILFPGFTDNFLLKSFYQLILE